MKKTMVSMLILAFLSSGIPVASAEISQDLDPNVSPDVQMTGTQEAGTQVPEASVATVGQTSGAVSPAVTASPEKKTEDKKAEKKKKAADKKAKKAKKKSAKKASSQKSNKSASQKSKKTKKSANSSN